MWVYYYLNDGKVDNMKMEIKWIVVDGVREAAKECTKCEKGFSKEGSEKCETCPESTYYDVGKVYYFLSQKECIKCKEEEFSFPNSYGSESCLKKNDCNKYDYNLRIGECKEGKSGYEKNITHHLCNLKEQNSTSLEPCDKCKLGFYLNNNNCIECAPGR
jgi:hypothetical protein